MHTQDFYDARKNAIGCSEIGIIMGKSKYSTPLELWRIKTGKVKPDSRKLSLSMKHGVHAESFIASEYVERTGYRIENPQQTIRHPTVPLVGTVDRLIYLPDQDKPNILEIKTVSPFQFTASNGWGAEGSSDIPESYFLQAVGYMAIHDCEWTDFAVLVGGAELKIYHVPRALAVEKSVLQFIDWWWKHHIVKGNEPTQDEMPPDTQHRTYHCDNKMTRLLLELEAIDTQIKDLQLSRKEINDNIIQACGMATELVQGKELIATVRRLNTKTIVEFPR